MRLQGYWGRVGARSYTGRACRVRLPARGSPLLPTAYSDLCTYSWHVSSIFFLILRKKSHHISGGARGIIPPVTPGHSSYGNGLWPRHTLRKMARTHGSVPVLCTTHKFETRCVTRTSHETRESQYTVRFSVPRSVDEAAMTHHLRSSFWPRVFARGFLCLPMCL